MESGLSGFEEWRGSGSHTSLGPTPIYQNNGVDFYIEPSLPRTKFVFWNDRGID